MPINLSCSRWQNVVESAKYFDLNLFSQCTLSNVPARDRRLWVHLAASYVLTLVTMQALTRECRIYTKLRHRFMASNAVHLRAILVERIPREFRSNARLGAYFSSMYPGMVQKVVLTQDLSPLEKLLARRRGLVTRLERSIAAGQQEGRAIGGGGAVTDTNPSSSSSSSSSSECLGGAGGATPLLAPCCFRADAAEAAAAQQQRQLAELNGAVAQEQQVRVRVMRQRDRAYNGGNSNGNGNGNGSRNNGSNYGKADRATERQEAREYIADFLRRTRRWSVGDVGFVPANYSSAGVGGGGVGSCTNIGSGVGPFGRAGLGTLTRMTRVSTTI